MGKPNLPSLLPVIDTFLLEIHWAEVEACFACDIIHVFSVVFCVVSSVHKFAFGRVTNEKPNKRLPLERSSCSDGDLMFLIISVCLPPTIVTG